MDCDSFLESLPEDGGEALDDEAARQHLDACAECRRIHASLFRGRAILRSLPTPPVSDDFLVRLEHRIDRLETRRRGRQRVARLASRLATAGATMAIAYLVTASALGRLNGVDSLRTGADPAAEMPSVRVVRPFASLASSEAAGLFAAEPEVGQRGEVGGWPPLLGLAEASGSTLVPERAQAVAYRWAASPAAAQPMLVATPSWTFAAAPASFHFVSAGRRANPPTFARSSFPLGTPSPRPRAE